MTIPINKDPDTEYKNEFMFGYTLKEVLCVAAALLIIAGVTQAAESLGVSKATLYRRHREYQKQAEYMNDDLPDLPT